MSKLESFKHADKGCVCVLKWFKKNNTNLLKWATTNLSDQLKLYEIYVDDLMKGNVFCNSAPEIKLIDNFVKLRLFAFARRGSLEPYNTENEAVKFDFSITNYQSRTSKNKAPFMKNENKKKLSN